MGGAYQLFTLLPIALGILAILLFVAFLIGRLFQDKKIRKKILLGAVALYLVLLLGYFGMIAFILSGNIN